jgi:hypothetical protein
MDHERWRLLTECFHAALSLPRGLRDEFVEQVCANDPELRAELESLLQASEAAFSFLEGRPRRRAP